MPAVSVVVPTFERPEYLRIALDSALAQRFRDFEILVGDNSETDHTERLLSIYDDPRIRYHRNRPSLGPQGNWLDLIERAQADLVATLHDDDFWDPQFLEAVVPTMIADSSLAMVFTDFWIVDEKGNRQVERTNHESFRTGRLDLPSGKLRMGGDDMIRLVAATNAPQPAYAAVLRRSDVLSVEYPEDTWPLYDIWFSYQMVQRGRAFAYDRRRLTNYRHHGGSLTSAGFAAAEDSVFRRILRDLATNEQLAGEVAEYWAGLRWARATQVMQQGGDRDWAQRELREAAKALGGKKGFAARAAGKSQVVWQGLRVAKIVRDQ